MKFTIPVPLRIAAMAIGATALYTYIGQLVPQKEVLPPVETQLREDMTTDELVQVGFDIAGGKGLCFTCHTVGQSGALRFPDLGDIAVSAETRIPGMGGLEYAIQKFFPGEGVGKDFGMGDNGIGL